MTLLVDVVTVANPPSYTLEMVRRLRTSVDCNFIASKAYAPSQVGVAYRLLDHPFRVALARRHGALLHVDSQMLAYLPAFPLSPPIVVTCYDTVSFLPEFDDPSYVSRQGLLDSTYYRLLDRGLRRATRIIAISAFVKSALVRLGFDGTIVDIVPMGVDQSVFHLRDRSECDAARKALGIPEGKWTILFVGSEHPRKNIGRLLRAFAQLSDLNAVLVKVGTPRYPQRANLRHLVKALGIEHRVLFLDRVSDNMMPLLYGAADVFVLPSLYEGFGIPPLEAMASGTPVAVSNVTSLPEVAADAALYFDPRDTEQIAAVLRTLLTDAGIREELRVRGRNRAALFPWERTLSGILESYDRAVAQGPGGIAADGDASHA